MKLSTLAISLLIVALAMSVISTFIVQLSDNYDVDDSQINLTKYNKMQMVYQQSENLSQSINKTTSDNQNIFDIIGNYFSQGLTTVKLLATSVDATHELTGEALEDTGLLGDGGTVKLFLFALLTIIVFSTILAIIIGDRVNKV